PAMPAGLVPPGGGVRLKVRSERAYGGGQGNGSTPSRRERVFVDWSGVAPVASVPHQVFSADLGAGVSARVPLKLYADPTGTLLASAEGLKFAGLNGFQATTVPRGWPPSHSLGMCSSTSIPISTW